MSDARHTASDVAHRLRRNPSNANASAAHAVTTLHERVEAVKICLSVIDAEAEWVRLMIEVHDEDAAYAHAATAAREARVLALIMRDYSMQRCERIVDVERVTRMMAES